MKKVVNYVLVFGFLFFGGMFLYALSMIIAYNELFDAFNYEKAIATEVRIEKEQNENLDVYYTYTVNGIPYSKKVGIYSDLFYSKVQTSNQLNILYNSFFPSLSYIQGLKMVRGHYFGLIFSTICILLLVRYSYSNKEYWFRKYKELYDKL